MVDKDYIRHVIEDGSSVDNKVETLCVYIEHDYLRSALNDLADQAMIESMYATTRSEIWEQSHGAGRWLRRRLANM